MLASIAQVDVRPSRQYAVVRYDRTVIAYHGCDQRVARQLLNGDSFRSSENDYDWLGRGIYFWEYGVDRALQFAHEHKARRRIKTPAVVGALVQLGNCFDLMDTRFTSDLTGGHAPWSKAMRDAGLAMPRNGGPTSDRTLRRLDCAVLNWYLDRLEEEGTRYDTVRCGFVEGPPVYEGAGIHQQAHVQIAVRNPACVLGVFRPLLEKR
jgi:hypothetical protein